MKKLKERFDTLSDAIIAIIMTILVLEIKIPENMVQLPQLAEAIGLFLVSFIIVTNFWYHRMQISVNSDRTTFLIFILDVLAHALLSLYPLATKMLVEFDIKWVAILIFGMINVLTGILLGVMGNLMMCECVSELPERAGHLFQSWHNRRMILVSISDVLVLLIALYFNQFGIYFYILSPFIEFLLNYKQGRRFEEALNNGQTFKDLLERRYGE